MGVNIVFEYPAWFLIFCVAAGALVAWFLYRRDKTFESLSPWLIRTMAVLRFIAVTIIAILLLSPLLKTNLREVEKPIIVLAQDNSESIVTGKDSAFYRNEYAENFNKLVKQLGDKYEVKTYSFGNKVEEKNEFNYAEKQTDISGLFDEINNVYGNRNVGAIVLASDGLFNKGSNPVYSTGKSLAPVYTIALGDTNVRKDVILSRVNHNRFAYLGNNFPLEIVAEAKQFKGAEVLLTVLWDSAKVFEKKIAVSSDNFSETVPVILEAKKPGLQKYTVRLSSLKGEVTLRNNSTELYIEVLDGRQKVLIVANNAHPDIAALRQAIEVNENYEVDVRLLDNLDKNINGYNLVVLHQIPSQKPAGQNLLQNVIKSGIPAFYILGKDTKMQSFNTAGLGLEIQVKNNSVNEVQAVLDENFSLFTLDDELQKNIQKFPPLQAPFGDYRLSPAASVMLKQRIGMVATDMPLLYFTQQGENKIGVLTGEGLWHWRLSDFSINGNHNAFNSFVSKIVQYLSVKTDKSLFRVNVKNHFTESEQVVFDAELYNESYELINEPEVNMSIVNSDNKKFPFTFTRTGNAYRLNAGNLAPGNYSYEATVSVGEKTLNARGRFTVSALFIETVNTVADHQLLYNLATSTGGKMFYKNELENLGNEIASREDIKPVIYNQKKLRDVIHFKWLFFLILFMMAAEWVTRKRNGAY
ncbi:MAG: hypothetical protein AB7G44_05635 [Bacteroidia bacterium]